MKNKNDSMRERGWQRDGGKRAKEMGEKKTAFSTKTLTTISDPGQQGTLGETDWILDKGKTSVSGHRQLEQSV